MCRTPADINERLGSGVSDDCGHGELLPLDAALASYSREVKVLATERLPVGAALHRVLAADVAAAVDLPMFTQSAVDGYAVRAADLIGADDQRPARLPVAGELRAGLAPEAPLLPGQSWRIFTGGRLPDGADAVARQEIVARDAGHAVLRRALTPGTDVRQRGEELRAGSRLARAGQRLHSGLIAALAMAGVRDVEVYCAPRVRVLVTGDEVSQAGAPGGAGIFDANGPLVRSWFAEHGYAPPQIDYVIDDRALLEAAMRDALDDADLLVTTGGVSVGDHDLIRPVARALGVRDVFWQVAQKPGKPLYFGVRDRAEVRPCLLLGLPGNPGAVLMALHVHVACALACLQNASEPAPHWCSGRISAAVRGDAREQLLRMALRIDDAGQVWLEELGKQESHMLSNLASASALVRVPAATSLDAGAQVRWLALS